jgi:hypothetical protein
MAGRFGGEMRRFFAEFQDSVRRTFFEHLALYICLAVFTPLTFAIASAYRAPISLDSSLFFLEMVPQFFVLGIFIAAVLQCFVLARNGSRRPLRDFGLWLYRAFTSRDRLGNAVHTILTITPLMMSFSLLKEDLPLIRPFSWDETFTSWDRALGFGRLPWEILQPWLGHPIITSGISFAYAAWFVVTFGSLIWQAFFARGTALRMQFLLAFALSWFLAGNVLAVVFSSAGPCYYGYLHTSDPYAAQIAYLRETADSWPVWSVEIQDLLWNSYAATLGSNIGISAMPSMHVEMAVLIAIVCLRTNRWLGTVAVLYAATIIVGSVHLGWHYAVDGIAATFLALLFWWVAGLVVRAQFRLLVAPPAVSHAAAGLTSP